MISVPFPILFSGVFFFSVIGSYLRGGEQFGVFVMVVFGFVGYLLEKFEFSFVTFIIGFIFGHNWNWQFGNPSLPCAAKV